MWKVFVSHVMDALIPLNFQCFFLIEAKPVVQSGTNACWQVANSWSNCKRSKVVLGIFKISFPA